MRMPRAMLIVLVLGAVACTNDYSSLRFVDESELFGGRSGVAGSSDAAGSSNGGQTSMGTGGSVPAAVPRAYTPRHSQE